MQVYRPRYDLFAFRGKQRAVFCTKLLKRALVKRLSYPLGEGVVKIQIVHYRKPAAKLFVCFEQVAHIRS